MSMATARTTRSRPAAGKSADKPAAAVIAAIGLAVLAILAFLIAWLAGWIRFTTDPRVTEILDLQEQARQQFAQTSGPASLADATAMVGSMMEIRQKVEALPEHLRPQVEQASGRVFQSAFRARIDNYFAQPPEKRQAEIDRQIDQEEMMRKAFETGRSLFAAVGGGGQSGTTNQAAPGGGQTPSGGQASGGPSAGPGNSSWGSRSEEDRNRWRKSMVDRTTPDERARYTEWRRVMEERRVERGLPARGSR
jgi:hypothetical protein